VGPQRNLYSLSVIAGLHIATMMAGYSILGSYPVSYGGYAFLQAHKNLKSIYLTFGYVGVAHWAAIDGWPQRWT